MLTDQEISHIAKLARIELTDERREKTKKEFSSILGYVKKLNEVPTEGVQPLYQVTGLSNVTRPDEHRGDFVMDEKLTERLVGQAPMHRDRLIKVKTVKNG